MTTGVAVAEEMMAEPISLSVGGRSMWGVAIVDSDANPNNDDVAISNDVHLVFSGSTVLDSGLEVSVRVDVDGGEGKEPAKGQFAAVSGSFGELRVGNQDTASYKMSTAAPYATYFYGINTPFWSGSLSNHWHSTFAGAGAGGASLMYFSPVINGFQFGTSYTPEADTNVMSNSVYSREGGDSWSIGGRYDGAFGDTGVTFASGLTQQDVPADDAAAGQTITDWNAGLVVSMSGVSVGGSYRNTDEDTMADDMTQYDIGIMYGEGPWAVSANFGNTSQDSENVDTDFSRLMATYNLGPGINMAGVLGGDSPDDGADTTFAAMALLISF